LVQIKVTITNHDFGPDYKLHLSKLHRSPPSGYTLYWKIFHCSRFLSNLRLPWKTEFALKFFTVLNILFTFRIFEQLALALKNSVSWNFSLYWIYFLSFRIFEQLALAIKNRVCPEIFHCIEYAFTFRIFEQLSLALKNIVCTGFFTVLKYFLSCRILEQLVLALKNRVCPEIFHCIEYTFYIQDFWATCACPEKQSVPWNFSLYWIYFLHSGFLSNLRLPWKTECALKFFTVLNILFTFRILEQLALALKTELPWNFSLYWNIFYHSGFFSNLRLPWNFSSPGGRPSPPTRTPMILYARWWFRVRLCCGWKLPNLSCRQKSGLRDVKIADFIRYWRRSGLKSPDKPKIFIKKNLRNHSYHQFYPVLAKIRINRGLLYKLHKRLSADFQSKVGLLQKALPGSEAGTVVAQW